ncbi:MAG: hypothetical protein Q8910_00830 [Bacteroidota bacterium]|nr:hypothetical protein [Bacteroidota bacterium]
MANKEESQGKDAEVSMIQPMASRININEAASIHNLSPVQIAGFKVFMGKIRYMYKEEWDNKIEEYLNR